MQTAPPPLALPGTENDGLGPDAQTHAKGNPPLTLLAGLAEEVVRRIVCRESGSDARPHVPSAQEIEALCRALLARDDGASAEGIMGALPENSPNELICQHYLAAAARRLGEWWTEDRASFAEVTVATGRILEMLRKTMATAPLGTTDPREVTVVFASVPGEQHTLGIRMAAELFRGDGWEIALKIGLNQEDLLAEIEKMPRCIVGLSIGGRHSLDRLCRLVEGLHARCPHAAIVVSGQAIEDIRPRLAALGLDGIAGGIDEAKEHISALWDREMTRKAPSVTGNG